MKNISHEEEKAVKIKFRSERRYPVSGRRTQKNFLTDPDYQPAAAGSDFQRRPVLRDEGPGPGTLPWAASSCREQRNVPSCGEERSVPSGSSSSEDALLSGI